MRVLSKQPLTPGCGLLPSPSATSREGRLSMKAHTQASTIPTQGPLNPLWNSEADWSPAFNRLRALAKSPDGSRG